MTFHRPRSQTRHRSSLFVPLLFVVACGSSNPSAGQGGQSGQTGVSGQGGTSGQPRPSLITTGHYQVGIASGVFATGGQAGSGAGGSGGGGGNGNTTAGGSLGASGAPALVCTPDAPAGVTHGVCGDGFLNANEQCDDGDTADGDACSSTCVVTPALVLPRTAAPSAVLPLSGRSLGRGAHPSAVGCNRVGVSLLDRSSDSAKLQIGLFSGVGHPAGSIDFGEADVDSPNPSIAALPDDSFVAVWTAFDSDELGIRLRRFGPAITALSSATFANVEQAFSQRAADLVFDGTELVVAWVDDSDPLNGPDLRYRTFAPDLTPTSDDLTLSATSAVEDQVTLAALGGHWAAAWRSGSAGSETIEVQSGAKHWSVGPFLPGASDDRPALTFIDANHLALAFTVGTDPLASGIALVPHLQGAILDAAYPGQTEAFEVKPTLEPYASLPDLGQTQPALASYGDRLLIAWRAASSLGDPAGDELWSREIKWAPGSGSSLLIDTSAPERVLIGTGALRSGDQARPTLVTSNNWSDHRLLSVWEDSARTFGASEGTTDVALQFSQLPGELPTLPTGPCSAVTIAASPPDGPATGASSVTLTAQATCGAGSEAEYRFLYQSPDLSSYGWIRGWGSAVANWNTAGLPSGAYPVYVYTRRKGSTADFESNAALVYLVGSVCHKDPTFQATPSGVQPIGTVLSLNASATCSGVGTVPEHLTYYFLPGTQSYFKVGDWSTAPVDWNTAGLPNGNYTLLTYLRGHGNTSGRESFVYGGALLGNVCYSVNSVTTSPATPQSVCSTIVLSATATCTGSTTPEFRYFYYGPGSSSATPIGSWSSTPFSWNTTGLPPGRYAFLAYARGVGNNSDQESSGYSAALQLGANCPSVSMSASPSAPQAAGTVVTLTANAGCTPAEYRFLYRLWGSSAWLPIGDWTSSNTQSWDTAGLASGNYEAYVDARIAGHVGAEVNTQLSYLVGDVCSTVSLSASPSGPHPIGTTVSLSASSTCTNGATAEYQFYYRTPSGVLTLIRDWGPATTDWSTASLSPGNYSTYAYARAQGNSDLYEAVAQSNYVFQ
jgi:cysteine-rich repeat protein